MPELPEVEALAEFLRERAVGRTVTRGRGGDQRAQDVRPARSPTSPGGPITASAGTASSSTSTSATACTWSSTWPGPAGCAGATRSAGRRRPSPGKGPIALRVRLGRRRPASTSPRPAPRSGSPSTSYATRTRCPASPGSAPTRWPTTSPSTRSPRCSRGRARPDQGRATDQAVIAGIGNAYSDEILHAAKMSPFKPADELDRRARSPRCTPRSATTLTRRRRPRSAGWPPATSRREKKSGLRGARPHRPAVPGVRRHGPRGVVRRLLACSTARPARPAASRSPTGGCPGCSSSCAVVDARGRDVLTAAAAPTTVSTRVRAVRETVRTALPRDPSGAAHTEAA